MCWQADTGILHLTVTAAVSGMIHGTSVEGEIFFKSNINKTPHASAFLDFITFIQMQQYHPNSVLFESFNNPINKSLEDPGKCLRYSQTKCGDFKNLLSMEKCL